MVAIYGFEVPVEVLGLVAPVAVGSAAYFFERAFPESLDFDFMRELAETEQRLSKALATSANERYERL